MAKDFDIALDTAKDRNAVMPMTSLMRQFLGSMKAQDKGELDFLGYATMLEALAGIEE